MYDRKYTWRAGEIGPVLRRIPIYRVTTLPDGKEVERLLVCEINGMYPGENDWVDTIVNAPQTKAERDQLLDSIGGSGEAPGDTARAPMRRRQMLGM